MSHSERIPADTPQSFGHNPFANLSSEGLPPATEGPEAVTPRSPALWISLCVALGFLSLSARSAELLDDRAITLHSISDVTQRRTVLIQYLWGSNGFPTRLPEKTFLNVACPV